MYEYTAEDLTRLGEKVLKDFEERGYTQIGAVLKAEGNPTSGEGNDLAGFEAAAGLNHGFGIQPVGCLPLGASELVLPASGPLIR